jgi:hypothetical protein
VSVARAEYPMIPLNLSEGRLVLMVCFNCVVQVS